MERLTKLLYKESLDSMEMIYVSKNNKKAINKLGRFEDFMEDNDIEEIEELQEIVERDKFEHLTTYPFEQKIQALEDRWNKLKVSIFDRLEFYSDCAYDDMATEYSKGRYRLIEDIYNEIQELEKEKGDE